MMPASCDGRLAPGADPRSAGAPVPACSILRGNAQPLPPNLHDAVAHSCLVCQASGNIATHAASPRRTAMSAPKSRLKEKRQVTRRRRLPCHAVGAAGSGPLLQPRAVLAAIQSPRAWRRRKTSAIPCSSGCASCRSRPTTSTSSTWCAWPASTARSPPASRRLSQDGLTPAQQLAEINRFASGLVGDQQACWIRAQGRDGRGQHPHRRAQGADAGRARMARSAVHHPSICRS